MTDQPPSDNHPHALSPKARLRRGSSVAAILRDVAGLEAAVDQADVVEGAPALAEAAEPDFEPEPETAAVAQPEAEPGPIQAKPETDIAHADVGVDPVDAESEPTALVDRIIDILVEALEGCRTDSFGVPAAVARAELRALEELGMVYRTGRTRGTRWHLG